METSIFYDWRLVQIKNLKNNFSHFDMPELPPTSSLRSASERYFEVAYTNLKTFRHALTDPVTGR
jgi:hypothetical protein